MLFGVKVSSNRFKRREKSLGLPWGFEASHASFSRSGRLMRVLGLIVQSFVRSMLHVLHHLFLGSLVTFKFVSDNHSWHKALFFEQLAKESLRCSGVPLPLKQDIEHSSL
jgi:hypothetical protein